MIRFLPLLLLAACSRGDDKERWQGPAAPAAAPAAGRTIELSVTDDGFVPTPVAVVANQPVTLKVTRKTDKTCATDIVIPDYGIEKKLPLNQTVAITFTPTKSGELVYGCSMDQMIRGVLTVQ
jgi:plastocyanin domain-containing protein